ncbi:hypothetical protein SAMN06265222_1011066 [Neorhodopirellula lusitana]|uniref:Uncharacterized protein n=1 Tax=Neorhodopirellula lusitana TaxID=445327 RepID=A0ABY1PTM1_9BACT|nr:hypothetical protein [Neorhodopirellula lusitana]SMP44050.1 hypothetical protein SAMN06265222_1011066 [Neorhodopirellula lusitana]
MTPPNQSTADDNKKTLLKNRLSKRPPTAMIASAVFILIGIAIMVSGAILEGAGALLVALGCSSIGLDPMKSKR